MFFGRMARMRAMSFGATIFGENGGCVSTDDGVNIAKAYGQTVLGESCGVAPQLPEAMLTDTEFTSEADQRALYAEAHETINALLVLARKQRWPTGMPVIEMLRAMGARDDFYKPFTRPSVRQARAAGLREPIARFGISPPVPDEVVRAFVAMISPGEFEREVDDVGSVEEVP